ncbi:MAG: PIN domain-containing protein [Deltaproteobacteria bacterium]|nr:PIN domain-containing protein [Deltaproteobacteria bacterium]
MAKKAVRVFLDSNVILSGLLFDKGAPQTILDLLCLNLPFLKGVTGRYNIMEIERNLAKKLPAALPVYEEYFPRLNLEIIPLPSKDELKKLSGHTAEKDIPVLASALKGRADFLVTGDKKDFAALMMKGRYPFRIMAPAEFLDIIPEFAGKQE